MSDIATSVSSFLTQRHCQAYVVGGYIRDWLLGRDRADIDIAVAGNALEVAQEVANEVGGKYVLLDEVNGIARVVVEDRGKWYLDLSPFSGDIRDDLARRDFTINAMAIELEQLMSGKPVTVIDPFGGEEDLRRGLLRAVSEQVFEQDAARLLRAVRLAAEFDLTIEEKTQALIRRYCQLVSQVPGERLREEWLRLLALPRAGDFVRYLDELGLLTEMFPELAEAKGAEQPKEHYWNIFDHSVETVAAVEFLLRERGWQYGTEDLLAVTPWSEALSAYFAREVSSGSNRKVLLKLAGLLHDIAKPRTKSIDEKGKMRFLGHAQQGAVMAAAALERLRFSSREIKLVESVIYHHLRPAQITSNGLPSHRAIYRYFRDVEGAGIDTLFLALADYLATNGPRLDLEEWQQHNQLVNYIMTEHFKQEAQVLPMKLVDGHDLMNIFGLSPGRLVGELLAMVREAQAGDELTTREEALTFIQTQLDKRQTSRSKAR